MTYNAVTRILKTIISFESKDKNEYNKNIHAYTIKFQHQKYR